jgi:hypothetical protein
MSLTVFQVKRGAWPQNILQAMVHNLVILLPLATGGASLSARFLGGMRRAVMGNIANGDLEKQENL